MDDADDDLAIERRHVGYAATRLGLAVEVGLATSLPEALAEIHGGVRPDLVISDVRLDGGSSGREGFVIKAVCASAAPPIPCYLISGTAPFTAEQARFIVVKGPGLRAWIEQILAGHAPPPLFPTTAAPRPIDPPGE